MTSKSVFALAAILAPVLTLGSLTLATGASARDNGDTAVVVTLQRRTSGLDMDPARTSGLDIRTRAFCPATDLARTSGLDTRLRHSSRVDIGVTSGAAVGGITVLARAGRGLTFTASMCGSATKEDGRAGAR